MLLTNKQKEFIKEGNHRYNIKTGATRSGKTYLDILYTIPSRIRERHGLDGLYLILGVTRETIERNVLTPLRDKFGEDLVGSINSRNICKIFGEQVYCLGAENGSQVSKIRGSSIKYCYCDELAEYNREVFELLKSRLDKEYSVLDATLNPADNNHWLKKEFIDTAKEKGVDLYLQEYSIFDNPFLPKVIVDNLCKEYAGTVYYNRYILGQWCNAEGLVYSTFANNVSKYVWDYRDDNGDYVLPQGYTIVGVDYGGTKSGQAFVCTRISYDYKKVIVLGSERHMGDIDPDKLEKLQIDFVKRMQFKYNCTVDYILPDNEEVVLIRGLRNAVEYANLTCVVRGCLKEPINDRIDCERTMIAYGVLYYIKEECQTFVDAMCTALWDADALKDTRLDDFSTDIDTLDAFEYSFTRYMKSINNAIEIRRTKVS